MQQLPNTNISSSTTTSSLPSDLEKFPLPLPPSPSTAATSAQPFSTNSQPISVQHRSNNSAQHEQQDGLTVKHNQTTKEIPKNMFPPSAAAPDAPAPASSTSADSASIPLAQMTSKQRLNANLLSIFNSSPLTSPPPSTASAVNATAAAASSSSSSSSVPPLSSLSTLFLSLDTTCHCLVVDESRLSSSSAELFEQYQKIMEMAATKVDKKILTQQVWNWINQDMANTQEEQQLCVAYVKENAPFGQAAAGKADRVLHLNFNSLSALVAAASKHSFLSRCGTTVSSAWSRKSPCGPEKSKLPELLHFSCLPTQMNNLTHLTSDVTKLLADAGIGYTCLWFPQRQDSRLGASVYNTKPTLLSFYILPRHFDADTLANIITQHHNKLLLWGGRLRIHAPNTPSLSRCTQCEELGHQPTSCPQYKGVGIRLLFKDPVPYAALLQLVKRSSARIGYLGQSTNESTPHRKVTLLFDVSSGEENETDFQTIQQHITPLVAALRSRLHQAPSVVRPMDRGRECRECGQMNKPHECPFMINRTVTRVAMAAAASTPSSSSSLSLPLPASSSSSSPSTSSRSPAASADAMCRSWRRTKTCPRRAKGLPCPYSHPEDHTNVKFCFDFAQYGHCSRGTLCKYEHVQKQNNKQTTQEQTNKNTTNNVTHTQTAAASVATSSTANTMNQNNMSSAAAAATKSSSPSQAPTVTVRNQTAAAAASSSSTVAETGSSSSSNNNNNLSRVKRKQSAADHDSAQQLDETKSNNDRDSNHPAAAAAASPQKRRKDTTAAAAASSSSSSSSSSSLCYTTLWSEMDDDDDDDEEEANTMHHPTSRGRPKKQPAAAVPTSSLSSITSPAKLPTRTSSTPTSTSVSTKQL